MRFSALALSMLLILLTGCSPTASPASSAPPVSGDATASSWPEVHPPADAINFGEVTMLLNSRVTKLDEKELQRQQRIMAAVSAALQRQTGVSMTLRAIISGNPAEKLKELATAGELPEICTWVEKAYGDATDADKLTATTLRPLALDAALLQYGQHLRPAIPEALWQDVTVGGHVAAVPMLCYSTVVAVLNQDVLRKYGWQTPKTVEEFEALLSQAKMQGLTPVLSSPSLGTSLAWYGLVLDSAVEEGGRMVPAMGSQRRLHWLRQQRTWIEKKWIPVTPESAGGESTVSQGTWLCREVPLPMLSEGDTVLPPLGAEGQAPGCLPLIDMQNLFECYARPEVMVFVLDWVYADAANNKLLSWGQEGVDYHVKDGKSTFESTLSWAGATQFTYLPIFHAAADLPANYTQAIEYARQSGGRANRPDGIPVMAWANRQRGSRLDMAATRKNEYEKRVSASETQVLQGIKTMEAHEVTLQECAPLMKEYLSLIEDLRDGKYDIWQDVQTIS